jgi:uncharacterized integral membrane protein (TIGR00698 family)
MVCGASNVEGTAIKMLASQPVGLQPQAGNLWRAIRQLAPGVFICAAITAVAFFAAEVETGLLGYPLLEPLVLALALGLVIRLAWTPAAVIETGIAFSAKQLLEFAIVILGATLDLATIAHAGPTLATAVIFSVTLTILAGILFGRLAHLPLKHSILLGVGSAVCGNSAIAAVAPAIRAKKQDVASAIALTAVLGVGSVLVLPLLIPVFGLTHYQFGVLGGLTIYAVPQVLAATLPVSAESGQIAIVVKLTRVLLLGPVVAIFAFLHRHEAAGHDTRFSLQKFIPWFVLGFLALALLRTTGAIPNGAAHGAQQLSRLLTAISMAALGLSVDLRTVKSTGPRVATVVLALTALLVGFALVLIEVFGVA